MQNIKWMLQWIGAPLSLSLFLFLLACTIKPFNEHDVIFLNTTCIQPYSRYTYRLGSDLKIKVDEETFIIPRNFETDLASIPRWYWSILAPQYSAFVEPGILHDYFYRCVNPKNRKYADEVFYYALLSNGVSRQTASQFFVAIRLFGSHHYSKRLEC